MAITIDLELADAIGFGQIPTLERLWMIRK